MDEGPSLLIPSRLLLATFLPYALLLIAFGLFCAGTVLLTIEPDEAWSVVSAARAMGSPRALPYGVDHPVVTSGGLYALLQGLMFRLDPSIVPHRLISIGFAVALVAVVYRLLTRLSNDRTAIALGLCFFVAAPGWYLVAPLALAEIIASTVLLLSLVYWTRQAGLSLTSALVAGVLFGVACATRMTCLGALPAIFVWSVLFRTDWRTRYLYSSLAIAMAVVVFAGLTALYSQLFGVGNADAFFLYLQQSAGLDPNQKLERRINFLLSANAYLPILGIIAITSWYATRFRTHRNSEAYRLGALLLLAGTLLLIAWLLRAPIAHVRYLWPAIPLLWIAVILAGLTHLNSSALRVVPGFVHAIVLAACFIQILLTLRALAVSESITLEYEFSGRTPLSTFSQPFAARGHQADMSRLVSLLDANSKVYSIQPLAAIPVSFEAQRRILSIHHAPSFSSRDHVLLLPSDLDLFKPSWRTIAWIENNTTLVQTYGDYSLRSVNKDSPGLDSANQKAGQ